MKPFTERLIQIAAVIAIAFYGWNFAVQTRHFGLFSPSTHGTRFACAAGANASVVRTAARTARWVLRISC